MKKKWKVIGFILAGFLLLLLLSGPILARLGMPVFSIQSDSKGRIRLVQLSNPARLPTLVPGSAPMKSANAQQVIIDTDMAADDWMAILYLLQRPDVDIRAITVTGAGEAHCEPGVRHARELALLAGQPEIPVACGRETPLGGNHSFPREWRENVDNLLGLVLPENPLSESSETAVDLMVRLVGSAPKKIHLIALGPLTNVAEALQADPALATNLQAITIMGGAVEVPGNVGPSSDIENAFAEWNFYVDPHAAAVVFASGAPITLVPLDATDKTPVTMAFHVRMNKDRTTPAAEFVYRVLTLKESSIRVGQYDFWDPLTAAILTDESLATFEELSLAVIEQEGPESGRTVKKSGGQVMRVAVSANLPRFENIFLDTLNGRVP